MTADESKSARSSFVALACLLALTLGACSDDPASALERAKAYRASGDNAAAAIELRNALTGNPQNPDLFLAAGEVLAELGDLPAAENALRRAMEFGRPKAEVVGSLARVLIELEKYPEALELLALDSKHDPKTAPQLSILRGRAYLAQRKLLEAKTEFHVSFNASPSAAAKLGLARVAMVDGDRDAADKLVSEAIEVEPRSADPLVVRAEFLRQAGRMDDAAAQYREGLKLVPTSSEALLGLAVLELSRDGIDVAKPLVDQAAKQAPQSPRLRFASALLAFKQKRNDVAIKELNALLRAIPRNGPGLMLTGMVQYAAGNFEPAQTALVTYLNRYPEDLAAWRMLGATLLAKGQPHLAASALAPFVAKTEDVGLLGMAADANRLMGRFGQARAILQRALKLAPENPDLVTSLALTDLATGARQRAIAGLTSAIELAPRTSRADYALIMVLLGDKQIERAEQAADALEKRLPDAATTYVLRGAVHIVKKDWPRARESLERALQIDPGNLLAVEALGDVDDGEQKPDRRRERVEAILKRDPKNVGALLALANLDLKQGSHEKGLAGIRAALSEQRESGNALLMLADVQFRYNQVGEAIISARQAHELHPFDARAIAVLAEAQVAMGDRKGAIATLSKLIVVQPDVVSGYLRLAAAQFGAGDSKGAAATVLKALEKSPGDRGARALLADIYLGAGELDAAQALAVQAQKDGPKDALGYRIEGDVMLARRDYARALEAYRKAAAIQIDGALLSRMHRAQSGGSGRPADDGVLRKWIAQHPEDEETRFYLADMLAGSGRQREAVEQYRDILRRQPNSARALNDLAWNLHVTGDKQALDYARQAVSMVPDSAAALDTLGWILVEQGNVQEGVPALLKAVSRDGNNPEIRYHLVKALLKIGDDARAKTELQTLLQSNKPFPELAEARALASKLGR